MLSLPGASAAETGALRRQTRSPQLDFVVVPTTAENIKALKQRLQVAGTFGQAGAVVHVQLAQGERLVFGAYDNFHRDCVVAFDPVPEDLLNELISQGILRGYQSAGSTT